MIAFRLGGDGGGGIPPIGPIVYL